MAEEWQILIIEDEVDGQEVAHDLLALNGFRADVVGTAEQAIQQLMIAGYDALVVDLALPGMDGIQLIEYLRADPRYVDLPAVAMTAYHSALVKDQSISVGFNAYLPKPIDGQRLARTLTRIINAGN